MAKDSTSEATFCLLSRLEHLPKVNKYKRIFNSERFLAELRIRRLGPEPEPRLISSYYATFDKSKQIKTNFNSISMI